MIQECLLPTISLMCFMNIEKPVITSVLYTSDRLQINLPGSLKYASYPCM